MKAPKVGDRVQPTAAAAKGKKLAIHNATGLMQRPKSFQVKL